MMKSMNRGIAVDTERRKMVSLFRRKMRYFKEEVSIPHFGITF